MTMYLPSTQARIGDEYLDDARSLRDRWKDVIPRGDLTTLQNYLAMLAYFVRMTFSHLVFTFACPEQRR